MAKRFIDTSFYRSPFVRGLKGALKSLYCFIICDCDGSGIWAADFEIASIYIGQPVSQNEFEEAFVKPGKAYDLSNGKYFFPDFLQHQYPKGLCATNPAQTNIISELKKYFLIDENLKPLPRPLQGSKVMVKVKVMDKGTGKVEVIDEKIPFENFWDAYEKKVGDKEKLQKKWDALSLAEQNAAMSYIPSYILSKPDKLYRKDPSTFLNNKAWNDELIFKQAVTNGKPDSKAQSTIDGATAILQRRGLTGPTTGNQEGSPTTEDQEYRAG